MTSSNTFWLNDPSILYRDGKYKEIIPMHTMTRTEKMNALTRLFIYLLLILIIIVAVTSSIAWIVLLPIVTIIFIVVLYKYKETGKEHLEPSVSGIAVAADDTEDLNPLIYNIYDGHDGPASARLPQPRQTQQTQQNQMADQHLFKNYDELYDMKNKQRIWCAGPDHGIPDQNEFASWLSEVNLP
jgi:hypothetical protein